MKRVFLFLSLVLLASPAIVGQEKKTDAVPKESVKLILLSVKPLDIEDEKHKWVTFRFKIDNNSGQTITVVSDCFSAFDGLVMTYLDDKSKVVHEEPWIQRCSPMGEARAYVLKPGVNEGFINCYLPNEKYARVRSFKMSGTLPGSEYKHQLESNTTRLDKQL